MEQRKDSEEKIDQILGSLDGMSRASAGPWFYTRLKARMNREEHTPWAAAGAFLARPAVAIVSLCLILVINVFVLLQQSSSAKSVTRVLQSENAVESESIIASNSSFDYENLAP